MMQNSVGKNLFNRLKYMKIHVCEDQNLQHLVILRHGNRSLLTERKDKKWA